MNIIKRNLTIIIFLCPIVLFGIENKHFYNKETYVEVFKRKISAIKILCDTLKYNNSIANRVVPSKSLAAIFNLGYGEEVQFDLLKETTKIVTDTGTFFALIIEIEKGITFDLTADSFNIPKKSTFVIADESGTIYKKFLPDAELKNWNSKNVLFLEDFANTDKKILYYLKVDKDSQLDNFTIRISSIYIMVNDVYPRKKRKNCE
jgi:hypothetical protein